MSFRGVDIRETGDRLIFRALLLNANGEALSGGTSVVRIFELQSDGSLKSYDFNDNTFKTTSLTTATATPTHQQGNNATYNTGIWTYVLSTLTNFTVGNIYIVQFYNSAAIPALQSREFQFGSGVLADTVLIKGVDATPLSKSQNAIAYGIASGTPTTTSIPTSAMTPAGGVADQFKGRVLTFTNDTTTAALRGQATDITASSNSATPTFTVTALATAPVAGDTFVIT